MQILKSKVGALLPLVSLGLHKEIIPGLHKQSHIEVAGSGNAFAKAYFIASIFEDLKQQKLVWIANSKNEMQEVVSTIQLFFDKKVITMEKHEDQLTQQGNIARFIEFMTNGDEGILLTTAEFLFSQVPSHEELLDQKILIKKGEDINTIKLFEALIDKGYEQSEDKFLNLGQYRGVGDVITVNDIGHKNPIRISFFGTTVEDIYRFDQETQKIAEKLDHVHIFPMSFEKKKDALISYIPENMYVINDEVEMQDFDEKQFSFDPYEKLEVLKQKTHAITLTAFPESDEDFFHLRYLSFLKYYTVADFLNDVKERYIADWRIVIFTKKRDEVAKVFMDNDINFTREWKEFFARCEQDKGVILILDAEGEERLPRSFQNSEKKIAVITDREVFTAERKRQAAGSGNAIFDFLASLKPNDYVVHLEHGVGRFVGIDKKTINEVTKEYLEVRYAENDKLFVPTDQADKISKFISNVDKPPKLTRLDSSEWTTLNKKVKKEAEKIAKELLQLYARREMAKGMLYKEDNEAQQKFEESFPYNETPGQLKAIRDVKSDMEKEKPMDRLVCGDVGFGKTEVAMRAAFKAVQTGKQVAFISPITILADQHYKTFKKRLEGFDVSIEMMSRFKSAKEQKEILTRVMNGEVDIVVGTHRLLQKDVKFKDLGLVIVDEEQRFGVKQKEKLKEFRSNVDVLTLTATPIPRTLHMSLNQLRDITTITTPPPGRLPIITEVRKFSDGLIRETILKELERGGQAYFLHNKVRTIEGVAGKLRSLIPEAKFLVVHGQLDPQELERRILQFKEKKFDVLISSTIIENGIDLANANTLIVNNADNFGLSQLYQLRGRVGRGRTQAYTYLLYSSRKLPIDAKKRLRAIVEASELGSGFQIAMKDLEIRGAGDILGSSQHGMMNSVGVGHFIRMLNQTIEEIKERGDSNDGDVKERKDVSVELPLTAFIPDWYIPEYEDKISIYQRLSSIKSDKEILEHQNMLKEEYGDLPQEVENLFKVITLKVLSRRAHVLVVRIFDQATGPKEANLLMGEGIKPENIYNLLNQNPKWFISGDRLKIKLEDLGVDWYSSLKKSIHALGTVPDKLA